MTVDWSKPPTRVERIARPDPTRRLREDIEPTEVIAVLELIDVTRGRGGGSLSGKARKRALDRMAIDCIDRGVPFIYHGRRFPGASE